MKTTTIGIMAIVLILLLAGQARAKKWYQGGTLHKATAAQWNAASDRNKLATAGDFVASLWLAKLLKPEMQNKIKSVDDIKPYAKQIVTYLDKTYRNPEPGEKVNETVKYFVLVKGWLKE